jgi:hypothetical protein
MTRLSIFARLVILAVVLLIVLVGSSLYLTRELHQNAAALLEQGGLWPWSRARTAPTRPSEI